MNRFFSSDWHLSHKFMVQNRGFDSINEMNELILNNFMSVIKSEDEFYFLGDLSWNEDIILDFFINYISKRKIKFYWILGNHDHNNKLNRYKDYCVEIVSIKEIYLSKDQSITMCHYPMVSWNKSHFGAWQLYGHHHKNLNAVPNMFLLERTLGKTLNVNCEFHNFFPWSQDEIVEYMKNRPDNWDTIYVQD